MLKTYKRRNPPLCITCKRRKNECPHTYHAPPAAELKEESTEGIESECPQKDCEHVPKEKGHFNVAVKQQDHLTSAEKECTKENENHNLHDMMELAAEPLAVYDKSLVNNISSNASEDQCCPDPHELKGAISIRGSSSSFLGSHSASDEKSTVTCSIPLPASCSSSGDLHNSSLKTTYTNEGKSSSLSMDPSTGSRWHAPPKTYFRKWLRKKDLKGLHGQQKVDVTCDGSLGSTNFVISQEGSYSKKGFEHALAARRNVESSFVGARSLPESGSSFKQADQKVESPLIEDISSVEVHPQVTEVNVGSSDKSVGLDFQEGPSGNSSNDSTVDPAPEPVSFNHRSSSDKESQSLSDRGLDTGGTNEIPCDRGSTKLLYLSIPPPGDCDVVSAQDEKCLGTSLNAPSGSRHSNVESSLGIKGLELLHGNIGEEAVCRNHSDLTNPSRAGTLGNSYLQLFPEGSVADMSRSMHQKDTAGAGSSSRERTLHPAENSGQDRSADAKSSLFLGLFLPMEVINNGHNRSSTSSQWLTGVRSREFLQDAVPRGFPDQPSASLRHKMMLDNIVNRTRTPKRNRSSCLNLYGYPTVLSEEELDSLWVGVRRYGRGNWEAMLRDPRLFFSALRTPRDLAQQWEEEQSKLFNTMPFPQGRHFIKPNVSQGSMDWQQPRNGKQILAEDVQLSLGDVYSGSNDSVRKRSLANFVNIQNHAPRQHQQSVTSMRTTYSYTGSHMSSMFLDNTAKDVGCSRSAKNSSTNVPMGRNCPHWLKELVAVPPKAAVPSDASAAGPAEIQQAKNPCIPGGGELQIGVGAQTSILPSTKGHDKAKQEQHPANDADLIVINSDASSEETISDHRSAKV